jgi:hypothetical protein
MRGLNNPSVEETKTEKTVVVWETPQPAPALSWMQKINQFVGKLKQKNIGKKIDNGTFPHGRTAVPEAVTGGMGGAAMFGETLLTVKHFRGGVEIPDSRREVVNKVVTDAGRDAIVDAFTGAFTLSTFNYHDCGSGTGNEAVGDTALGTAVAEDRATGTQSQPSADVYKTIGTVTFANSYAITEHGLFSQAAKPGGTLLDRSKFAAVNVVATDKIEFTFTITFASGG